MLLSLLTTCPPPPRNPHSGLTCWNSSCSQRGTRGCTCYCEWHTGGSLASESSCICCAGPGRSWSSRSASLGSGSKGAGRSPRTCHPGRSCDRPRTWWGRPALSSCPSTHCGSRDPQRCSHVTYRWSDKLERERKQPVNGFTQRRDSISRGGRASQTKSCQPRLTSTAHVACWLKRQTSGLPWWLSGKESACQRRGLGFHPWPRKMPRAKEQPSLLSTTTEPICHNYWIPCALELMLCNEREAATMRSRRRATREEPPLVTAREKAHTATKTQHSSQ